VGNVNGRLSNTDEFGLGCIWKTLPEEGADRAQGGIETGKSPLDVKGFCAGAAGSRVSSDRSRPLLWGEIAEHNIDRVHLGKDPPASCLSIFWMDIEDISLV
jgi:hypothetical protein